MDPSPPTHPGEREVFLTAVEIASPAGRAAYLDVACGEDGLLRSRVEALLAASRQARTMEPPRWFREAAWRGGASTVEGDGSPEAPRTWKVPSPEELTALLDGYEVESLIDCGGMGAVYRAVQTSLERPVAIKILPPGLSDEPGFAERFRREALVMAKLHHPNIVTIFDFGSVPFPHPAGSRPGWNLFYFVMEYIEGTDVRRLIRGGELCCEAALTVIAQICEALHYAHSQGYVHRDIKPANVFVTAGGTVKVGDFGIARLTGARDRAGEESRITFTGNIMGTPNYLAPESLGEGRKVDHRADIYSLGVMFYEMLTGTVPKGVFLPPSQTVPIDARLDHVVLKAIQSEPDRRYQHAAEIKHEVDDISASLRKPAAPSANRRDQSRRFRKQLGTFGAMVGVLAAGAGFYKWKTQPPPPPIGTFVNGLGMRFLPVPVTGGPTGGGTLLFSVWETRVRDYAVFAESEPELAGDRSEPKVAGLAQGSDHPAVNVSWDDARAFCVWLTERERTNGVIRSDQEYRLPSDHEWSCAVGIGELEDPEATPAVKREKVEADTSPPLYPWGTEWPPPQSIANLNSESTLEEGLRDIAIVGYIDGYAITSPVGSFPANRFGLHDLCGNASEWCADILDPAVNARRVIRGASWSTRRELLVRSGYRSGGWPDRRLDNYGFRVVLAETDSP